MDIRLIPGAVPSQIERDALDALIGPPASDWQGNGRANAFEEIVSESGHDARSQRRLLLPALHAMQNTVGYLTPGGINYVCQRLSVPPADAYGVASFYALFALEERPPIVAHVCDDIACRLRGGRELCAELERRIGPAGTSTSDGSATWLPSPCLGLCEHAPAALIQRAGAGVTDSSHAGVTIDEVLGALSASAPTVTARNVNDVAGSVPQALDAGSGDLRLLRRAGRVDPTSIDAYRASGGFEALREAFRIGPHGVIRETQASRLLGRGGAAFPAGRKLEDVARAPVRPHYIVCNADESEPGTFKDRVLMEVDPFAIVEGMTIAGYAAGCERGYLYIRGEYPLATRMLTNAIDSARQRGFLGENIMGERVEFDIELRVGAGAYICGEETALFESIEGKRGEPRNKPPFPTMVGLFGKPTLVNNVETLVNLQQIVLEGGEAFASSGTEGSTGPKLFCLSGAVRRPGIYEVTFGATLRELIELAGGLPEGRALQAVLLGGAAGTFVTEADLDVPLTFEGTRAIGASLGSGVIMVFDDTVDMVDIVLRIASFFRDESCGQCVPCRVGTVRQEEALHRLANGRALGSASDDIRRIDDLALVMRDASICGLGHTAANAVQSAIRTLHIFDDRNTQ
ncbi:MAG TPA: NAD(P)H-dependent oxidoreductase subunit E [Thermomicrobiales bacterium]|nr:NAD(P)H-dependent oxidoreductase subunit E [Thermomicrobiales bacterium]